MPCPAHIPRPPSRETDQIAITLPEEIKAATQHHHSHLNRLILARLPLALPPHINDPRVYATGLLHFVPIYITFETAWESCISFGGHRAELQNVQNDEQQNRMRAILRRLYMPGLLRTERLYEDLRCWLNLTRSELAEIIEGPRKFTRLNQFIAHVKLSTHSTPHVLIAYCWVMYMALFNGGRWMRSELLTARAEYSKLDHSDVDSVTRCEDRGESRGSENGAALFQFAGDQDGEDIKQEFKTRLAEVEGFLTDEERRDVVAEAEAIFAHCIYLVDELDQIMENGKCAVDLAPRSSENLVPMSYLMLKHIFPMGMVDLISQSRRWLGRGDGSADLVRSG